MSINMTRFVNEQDLDEIVVESKNKEIKLNIIKMPSSVKVEVRVVFLTIQNVDSTKDCFTAEVYIEGRWKYNKDVTQITAPFEPEWKPDLQIANIMQIINPVNSSNPIKRWYRLGQNNDGLYAFEMTIIKGVFYENLELNRYPFDTQELTIDVVASESTAVCQLVKHESKMSYVNTRTFRCGQEWYLYAHVTVVPNQKDIREKHTVDGQEHSLIKFKCNLARIPTYFCWNAFFLIFLITLISFCPFAVPITKQDSRLIISVTLMLTSVSFKWVVNRSLPPISYLTTLDVYSIFGIAWTTTLAAWHALYGYFYGVWYGDWIDHTFIIVMAGLFFIINLWFLLYLVLVIYKPRRIGAMSENLFKEELGLESSGDMNFFNS